MFKKYFIDACLNGEAVLDDVEDYIEYWHTHKTDVELHEFLGMTSHEYANWLKDGEDTILHDIIETRGKLMRRGHLAKNEAV